MCETGSSSITPMASRSTGVQPTSCASTPANSSSIQPTDVRNRHNVAGDELGPQQNFQPRMSQSSPRTCRICYETVQPRIDPSSGQSVYESSNPADGRLIRPCKCSGSQKYIHEACLQSFRHHSPLQGFFSKCPTCGYTCKLATSRLQTFLAHSSTLIIATITLIALSIFAGGYVAIPLLSYTIRFRQTLEFGVVKISWYTADRAWLDHFAQGAALTGLTGIICLLGDVVKTIWTRVWHPPFWFMGFLGTMSAADSTIGFWVQIAWGILRVAYWIWCIIGSWCRRRAEYGGRSTVLEYCGDSVAI